MALYGIIIKFSFSRGSIPTDLYPHERILMSLPRPDTASNTTIHTCQCTLHTKRFTLHTTHCTLATVYYTLRTIQCILHTVHCRLFIIHATLQNIVIKCTQKTAQSCTAHCSLNAVHWMLHSAYFSRVGFYGASQYRVLRISSCSWDILMVQKISGYDFFFWQLWVINICIISTLPAKEFECMLYWHIILSITRCCDKKVSILTQS